MLYIYISGMDGMFIMAFVILGIMGLGLVYYGYRAIATMGAERKKEKEYKEYLAKSMEEDYFIDPETGQKFTLEEAEAGVDFGLQNTVRPDDEIEKQFYDEHEREVAFVKNNLLKNKYKAIEPPQLNPPVHLYGRKATVRVHGVFTKDNGQYMQVTRSEFTFQRTRVKEDKIVIVYHTNQFMGHAVIWETDMLAKLENIIDGSQKISPTGKYTVNVIGDSKKQVFDKADDVLDTMKGVNEEIIDKVTEVLEQHGKCECEVVGETIYIKSTVAASRPELERMLEIEAHLSTLLQPYLKS